MALKLISKIIIEQRPTTNYPTRSQTFVLNFVNHVEINSSWKNLTDTCKLIFPKNLYVQTANGLVAWQGKDFYGDNGQDPIMLRGDKISVYLGYNYQPTQGGDYVDQLNLEFQGYITKVNPKIPMEIECEDNMWLLKQAQCPNMVFSASKYNVQSILQYLLNNSSLNTGNTYISNTILTELAKVNVIDGFGANETIAVNVGDFRTQNETIAKVLDRLRKDYKLECFFRGYDLYACGVVYNPDLYFNSQNQIFSTAYDFQNNILTSNMNYVRKDDLRLGIKAYSVDEFELTTSNANGGTNTNAKRLETTVGDQDGEIRTQYFWNVKSLAQLTTLATQQLTKLKFEGWHGSFVSLGLPYVQHGNAITIKDAIIPERQGTYLVKGVKVTFGVKEGFRRELDLHIRVGTPTFSPSDYINGL